MEQRKIMQLGRSSLVISLPKDWLKRQNLKQGDLVSINIINDGSLQIAPLNFEGNDEKKINLYVDSDQDRNVLTRSIIACYLNGYSDIKLIAKTIFTTSQLMTIRKVSKMLYIRIIESDNKNVSLSALINESKINATTYLQRMYLISYSMCKDVFQALIDHDLNLAKNVYIMDDDVDHFYYLMTRLLKRASLYPAIGRKIDINPIDIEDYLILISRIEHIADHAVVIAEQLISLEGKKFTLPKSIVELIYSVSKFVLDMYEKAFKSFFEKDINTANLVIENLKFVEENIIKIAQESFTNPDMNPITVCSVCTMRDTVKRIADWAVEIAEHAITRAYFNL